MTVNRSTKQGVIKRFDLAYGDLTRFTNLESSPITLPASEPGTGQVSYTVQQTDFCTITPSVPMKNFLTLFASGKATAAGAISYRILKNGVSVANGTNASTPINNYWNNTYYNVGEVQVGDVIEYRVWGTGTLILECHGMWCTPSQPQCFKPNVLLKDLTWTINPINTSNLFPGNGLTVPINGANTGTCAFYFIPNATFAQASCAGNTGMLYLVPNTTYGAFRSSQGDYASTLYNNNGTSTRNYQLFNFVSAITFREVYL